MTQKRIRNITGNNQYTNRSTEYIKKSARVELRVTEDFKKYILKKASEENKTVSQWLVDLIKKADSDSLSC